MIIALEVTVIVLEGVAFFSLAAYFGTPTGSRPRELLLWLCLVLLWIVVLIK
jgi:hypothetical protein